MSMRKYFIELRRGESIAIGSAIISLEHKSGSTARLVVLADESIPVKNPEQIKKARRSAPLLPKGEANGKYSV